MKKTFLIIAIILVLYFSFGIANLVHANVIQDITDSDNPKIKYPVRDNALVFVLQPVPDNSGDYTMTICNKQSRCMQTSMRNDEMRYLGMFLEDMNSFVTIFLKDKLTGEQWIKRQSDFRKFYADYMNMYDKSIGEPQVMTPEGIKLEATEKKW